MYFVLDKVYFLYFKMSYLWLPRLLFFLVFSLFVISLEKY